MRKAADLSFRFLILVVLIIIFALVVDWFDPWALVASRVRAELANNTNLEGHLQGYGVVAQSVRLWLKVPVSFARHVVVLIDPLGDAAVWQEALSQAGKKPGGRVFLESIRTFTHSLVELDKEIATVARLPVTAQDLANLHDGTLSHHLRHLRLSVRGVEKGPIASEQLIGMWSMLQRASGK